MSQHLLSVGAIPPSVRRDVSSLPVSNSAAQTSTFGAWLRAEMDAHGYTDRGALTRLAKEAGVNKSTVSRAINEGVIPDINALRGLGRVLGHTLGEMLVHAGIATPDELPVRAAPPEEAHVKRTRKTDPVEQELLDDPNLDEADRERWLRLHRNLKAEIRDVIADARKRKSER